MQGPKRPGRPTSARGEFHRPEKPPLRLQPTTLWEYPSQHYGEGMQGDSRYVGATPSFIVWNLVQRYTREGDRVVDPMCGSGTTLDVCRDTKRVGLGFDLASPRPDVIQADARKLPVEARSAQLFFVDPPYGDHIDYSDDARCIGKLSAYDPAYYREMGKVLREAHRVLVPGGTLAVYVCDVFDKKRGFAPVGGQLLAAIAASFELIDVVCVVRHNKSLEMANHRRAAEEGNFYLRGFNYLILARR